MSYWEQELHDLLTAMGVQIETATLPPAKVAASTGGDDGEDIMQIARREMRATLAAVKNHADQGTLDPDIRQDILIVFQNLAGKPKGRPMTDEERLSVASSILHFCRIVMRFLHQPHA